MTSSVIKRPTHSLNKNVIKNTDCDNSLIIEDSFKSLCSKGLIKSGMIVTFKKNTFTPIKLEYEDTGVSYYNNEYSANVGRGIIISQKNGSYAIVTALIGDGIYFKGRFARAYWKKTLEKVKKSVSKECFEYKEPNITTKLLSTEEFFYYINNSYLFSSYIYNLHKEDENRDFFVDDCGSIYLINPYCLKLSKKIDFSDDKKEFGSLLLKIIPKDAKCCVKEAKKVKTREATTYLVNSNQTYLVFWRWGLMFKLLDAYMDKLIVEGETVNISKLYSKFNFEIWDVTNGPQSLLYYSDYQDKNFKNAFPCATINFSDNRICCITEISKLIKISDFSDIAETIADKFSNDEFGINAAFESNKYIRINRGVYLKLIFEKDIYVYFEGKDDFPFLVLPEHNFYTI